ncbi:MAG: N-acetylmuramoyl-L-alanine amidase [Oscillatoriophycideae cyanobacterium NC_groundwater_1537_Pr4_S-0.65um_50_18]|nr:N-acetylmuramoyl-L-alanine amidase [Oscillatoriophycideae cyanobacterium NC_groundwater_1537_Pr4_S-0.65um_50_18]
MALKIHWLLPSFLGICCLAAPAEAGQLSSWRFDPTQNRLEFNTDEGVQPRAQLLSDPTRLVIDLPGTTIAQSAINQTVGREIQRIRVGQLDANTTRIVVELSPGYTLDPQQIRFQGVSPTQWTVQLPAPQAVDSVAAIAPVAAASVTAAPIASSSTPRNAATRNAATPNLPTEESAEDSTQIESLQVTADGLFVRTKGVRPVVEVDRRDRQTIRVTVSNAVLSPRFTERDIAVNRYGISRLELQSSSDQVQMTLHVAADSPDWLAAASGATGIVMLPQGGIADVADLKIPAPGRSSASESTASATSARTVSQPPQQPSTADRPAASTLSSSTGRSASTPLESSPSEQAEPAAIATIQGIEVNPTSNQLVVRADRPVTYSGRWQSGVYQITLSPAQLASNVSGSDIGGANSPVLRARLRQQTDQTVVISLQPASGVRFGTLNMVSPQLLALEMQRSPVSPVADLSSSSASSSSRNMATLLSPTQSMRQPSIPSGRLRVVIDPGHGGSDPGAVGIGGLQEKKVVLAIAEQVASYLEQQGVQVIMTRSDDSDVELEPRVQIAEQANASLFVSIHANAISLDRPEVNGIETYYFSSGEQLAQVIQDTIVRETNMNDKGIRQARFYVLRRTSMPAVLIETGFVTGSEDAARLADEGFRNQMARAIAQGILQYVQQNSTAFNR